MARASVRRSANPGKPVLREEDFRVILKLLRAEARRMGYGSSPESSYTIWNEYEWPRKLKKLKRVAGKIEQLRDRP